jgi:hypothetical protein
MQKVKGYTLMNPEKFERALNGVRQDDDSFKGGVGDGAYKEEFEDGVVWMRDGEELTKAQVDILERDILAEYDRIGGLIKRGNDKVKTGSFYNFKGRRPFEEPKVVFVYNVNGKIIEVEDGVELPGEVKAARMIDELGKSDTKPVRKLRRKTKAPVEPAAAGEEEELVNPDEEAKVE